MDGLQAATLERGIVEMRIRVLGCSGGIGGGLRTTALLVDDDVLIDAGTGVGDLSLESLAKIDHIFVSHSHLDHVTSIPFLVDTVCWMRAAPIIVYGIKETLDILRAHLFNWKIWPDFTQIPNGEKPFMVYREIKVGEVVELKGRRITAIPANHTVPAVGYRLESSRAALIFSGDTCTNDALWRVVNSTPNLKYLIIETAFSNKERHIAADARRGAGEDARHTRGVHHPLEAGRGRAHDEGSEPGRRALAAADAREQPGILPVGPTFRQVPP